MAPDDHTPLESLLLFQLLHPFTAAIPSFNDISNTLKDNELIRESDLFDLGRLEPDSLKKLYLRHLKEQATIEAGHNFQPDSQHNPRKRKLSSPPLETVEEATEYIHLLPQTANRLYFRYQDHAFKAIEEEERRYRSLQRDIEKIERGERDAKIRQGSSKGEDTRGVTSIETLLQHDDDLDTLPAEKRPKASLHKDVLNGHDMNVSAGATEPLHTENEAILQASSRPEALPPASTEQNLPTTGVLIPSSQSGWAENGAPCLPPSQQINHTYASNPSSSGVYRKPPLPIHHPSNVAPTPSPRSNQVPLPISERSSASPIILPPPPGMLRSSGSPTGPLDALADMAGQQYRSTPTIPSPRQGQNHGTQQHPNHLPAPRDYSPRNYNYYDNQSPYPPPYPPYNQGPLSTYQQQQSSTQGYPGPIPVPNHNPPYGQIPKYHQPVPAYSPHPGYNPSPGYYHPPPVQPHYPRHQLPRFSDQQTPISTPGTQHPPKPSPIYTPASSTKWKLTDEIRAPRSPTPPRSRDISPISDRHPSPSRSPSPDLPPKQPRGTRGQESKQGTTDVPTDRARSTAARGNRSRAFPARGRRLRAGSLASSAVQDSVRTQSRSRSITSHSVETPLDNQNRSLSTRNIKPEPSGTSAIDDDASVASHTADEGSRKSTRRRRGTLRSLEKTEANQTITKRKPEGAKNSPSLSPPVTAPSKQGYVLGTRNFPRTSATLMNDISAHKVASLFAKPLTEREAPGYNELVYRPQDLKSIRSAINNGSKALVAASENTSQESNASSVWIPETPDVIPPKGIVNSAQLEKELMRMFANAIMFNPDLPSNRGVGFASRTWRRIREGVSEDVVDDDEEEEAVKGKQDVSVVKDTRDMFEAVERNVREWRAAERTAEEGTGAGTGFITSAARRLRGGEGDEEDEEDELAKEEVIGTVEEAEEVVEPKPKRRRR